MTFDKTQITDINKAKNAEYNGQKLTDEEQREIFDKNATKFNDDDGNLDVTKLQNTAELLNKVKQSQVKVAKDSETNTLLNELKNFQTTKGIPYQVVNGYQNLVQVAIARLEKLNQDKTLNELQAELTAEEGKISGLETEVKDKEQERNALLTEIEAARKELEKEEDKKKGIEDLIKSLKNEYTGADATKNDAVGKKILDNIIERNKRSVGNFDSDNNLIETKLSFGVGRK